MLSESTLSALKASSLHVAYDAPLLKRTYWRAGGAADALVDCGDLATLCEVRRIATETECPFFVLGNASNLLVADAGIPGIVVRLTGALAGTEAHDRHLFLGGGAKLVVVVSRMLRHGWTGLEFLAGIPGTAGGAVRMNAGTHLGEVVDALEAVEVVLPDASVVQLPASALKLSYRHSELPDGAIVTQTRFRLTEEDPEASKKRIEAHLDRRRETQPIDIPTCGSTFRNPPGDTAGRLIEACGLKGFQIGQARVSHKHANFVENHGGASAREIRAVVEHVQHTVEVQTGISLHREVHFVGAW